MATLTYQPPLRGAILWALARPRAVSAETLAEAAQVELHRARAFLSILAARQAVRIRADGLTWERGPGWERWAAWPSRARPHQSTHRAALDEIDAMRFGIAREIRAAAESRGWSPTELARRSRVSRQYVYRLWQRSTTPPACHLALLARTLSISLDALLLTSPAQMRH